MIRELKDLISGYKAERVLLKKSYKDYGNLGNLPMAQYCLGQIDRIEIIISQLNDAIENYFR